MLFVVNFIMVLFVQSWTQKISPKKRMSHYTSLIRVRWVLGWGGVGEGRDFFLQKLKKYSYERRLQRGYKFRKLE